VLIPDRRGNNRVDTLRNLVADPRISLLFLIPGVGETLRINGRAEIVTDPALRESFVLQGKAPVSVLVATAERVYYQCPKALIRSRLWHPEARIARSELPSSGDILAEITSGGVDGGAYDRAYPQRLKETLY
jgi:PPOX class probable FMN-dependent enzyme